MTTTMLEFRKKKKKKKKKLIFKKDINSQNKKNKIKKNINVLLGLSLVPVDSVWTRAIPQLPHQNGHFLYDPIYCPCYPLFIYNIVLLNWNKVIRVHTVLFPIYVIFIYCFVISNPNLLFPLPWGLPCCSDEIIA